MERYICIHGHFYQPPRENPWLEAIELQDSAYPYHDWNERITAECYAPNTTARILNERGMVVDILNNFAGISFNFGPTLLAWLQESDPETYRLIREADRASRRRYDGHGSALAQAYNHIILPLANERDRLTQILWGIRDFRFRFEREPEGMWLPETAVDLHTLDILAQEGILFTILAPRQARRYRRKGQRWKNTTAGGIDPSTPYQCSLPSGRKMTIFFYDGPISQAVAFEQLLDNGEELARRITGAFVDTRSWTQLVSVATDGESYGHHHRQGELGLAYALDFIEREGLAKITNFGGFLAEHPPELEVEIHENSSWSCVHGLERWKSDCGCSSGGRPNWHQKWRAPLREALDWLRDSIAGAFEERGAALFRDPWRARDEYINVIIDRTSHGIELFFMHQAGKDLDIQQRTTALQLMEMQRHALLMYTSCGWFFDDISGLESVQCLQYAGRAIQLARDVLQLDLEEGFLRRLEKAPGNVRGRENGRLVYEKSVRPCMVDLKDVCAHYAVNFLFEPQETRRKIYSFDIALEESQIRRKGHTGFAVGQVRITSLITRESNRFTFGVLHLGDHNINAGVREFASEEDYRRMAEECSGVFLSEDFASVIRSMDFHFGSSPYSLKSLFRDPQRLVIHHILQNTLGETEALLRQIRDSNEPLMSYLVELGHPLPRNYRNLMETLNNWEIFSLVGETNLINPEKVQKLLKESNLWRLNLDRPALTLAFEIALTGLMRLFQNNPEDLDLLRNLLATVRLLDDSELPADLYKVQNIFFDIFRTEYEKYRARSNRDDGEAWEWLELFDSLGGLLSFELNGNNHHES